MVREPVQEHIIKKRVKPTGSFHFFSPKVQQEFLCLWNLQLSGTCGSCFLNNILRTIQYQIMLLNEAQSSGIVNLRFICPFFGTKE